MKEEYIAPELTVITFKVERGFEGSVFSTLLLCGAFSSLPDEDLNQAANYNEQNWSWD